MARLDHPVDPRDERLQSAVKAAAGTAVTGSILVLIGRGLVGAFLGGIGGICGGWVVGWSFLGMADEVAVVESGLIVVVLNVLGGSIVGAYAMANPKVYRPWLTAGAITGAAMFGLLAARSAYLWRMHTWEALIQIALGLVGGAITGGIVSTISGSIVGVWRTALLRRKNQPGPNS